MNTLIVYASYYGTTEKIAYKIKESIACNSIIINSAFNDVDNWKYYDKVIICTPIHIDRPHKAITKFIKKHQETLCGKEIHLVVCGLDENWINSLAQHFSSEIVSAIKSSIYIGGKLNKEQLTYSEKKGIEMMEKKLNVNLSDVNTINESALIDFVKNISQLS